MTSKRQTFERLFVWNLILIQYQWGFVSAQNSNNVFPPSEFQPEILRASEQNETKQIKFTYDWGAAEELSCRFIEGNPTALVRWIYNEMNISTCELKYTIVEKVFLNYTESTLRFKRLNSNYTGNYTCQVINKIGTDKLEFYVEVCIPWSKILSVSIPVGLFCFFLLVGIIILFIKKSSMPIVKGV